MAWSHSGFSLLQELCFILPCLELFQASGTGWTSCNFFLVLGWLFLCFNWENEWVWGLAAFILALTADQLSVYCQSEGTGISWIWSVKASLYWVISLWHMWPVALSFLIIILRYFSVICWPVSRTYVGVDGFNGRVEYLAHLCAQRKINGLVLTGRQEIWDLQIWGYACRSTNLVVVLNKEFI